MPSNCIASARRRDIVTLLRLQLFMYIPVRAEQGNVIWPYRYQFLFIFLHKEAIKALHLDSAKCETVLVSYTGDRNTPFCVITPHINAKTPHFSVNMGCNNAKWGISVPCVQAYFLDVEILVCRHLWARDG